MKFLNIQLNTDAAINRDIDVELVSEASGARKFVKPYLDGSVRVNDLEPGNWRVLVKHPNLNHNLIDRRITVLPDRPTFVPLQVPKDIFSDVAIRATPEADLTPDLARLDELIGKTDQQAKKVAGQPIFAGDWNAMAGTIGDVARSTRDLAMKVTPIGHDHPELVEKIDELQANLERFFDVFGSTVVHMQRQIQQLALAQQAEAALDKIPDITKEERAVVTAGIAKLNQVAEERPDIYSRELKRVGERLHEDVLAATRKHESLDADEDVVGLLGVAREMARMVPAKDFQNELVGLKRIGAAKAARQPGRPLKI